MSLVLLLSPTSSGALTFCIFQEAGPLYDTSAHVMLLGLCNYWNNNLSLGLVTSPVLGKQKLCMSSLIYLCQVFPVLTQRLGHTTCDTSTGKYYWIQREITIDWTSRRGIQRDITIDWASRRRIQREITIDWASRRGIQREITIDWASRRGFGGDRN